MFYDTNCKRILLLKRYKVLYIRLYVDTVSVISDVNCITDVMVACKPAAFKVSVQIRRGARYLNKKLFDSMFLLHRLLFIGV